MKNTSRTQINVTESDIKNNGCPITSALKRAYPEESHWHVDYENVISEKSQLCGELPAAAINFLMNFDEAGKCGEPFSFEIELVDFAMDKECLENW